MKLRQESNRKNKLKSESLKQQKNHESPMYKNQLKRL